MIQPSTSGSDHVTVLASGFAQLLASQVSTRLLTFSLNLLIARHLSPDSFALLAVQFHLILSVIVTLSRDGFRRGCLRLGARDGKVNPYSLLAVSWLVIPVGAAVSAVVCFGVLAVQREANAEALIYRNAVVLHGIAAFFEVLAEPFAILAAASLHFRIKVVVEAAATLARCGVTYVLVAYTRWQPAYIFSAAQLALALVTTLGYGAYGVAALLQVPKRQPGHSPASISERKEALWMTGLFTLQAAEKLVLSESSKFVMAAVQSRYNQGVFGLVSNLGSLLVRTLFQPLEEVAFTAFSRYGSAKPHEPNTFSQLAQALGALVKSVSVLGLLAVAFGPAYSYTLLRVLYSLRWSETEAPNVLAWYCGYVLLVAVNGVTEAFVHAVLDRQGLQQANAILVLVSVTHLAVSVVAVRAAGATGLVLADAANMALRIAYSMWYIHRYFKELPNFSLCSLLPTKTTLSSCAVAACSVLVSRAVFMSGIGKESSSREFLQAATLHVAAGAAVLVVLGAVVYKAERSTFVSAMALRQARGSDTTMAQAAATSEAVAGLAGIKKRR